MYAESLYRLLKECKETLFGTKPIDNIDIKTALDKIDFDMLGDAYESFKEGEVGNAGKLTGQYFTPRCVIRYMIDTMVRPSENEIMYDSSCGTGGFIHYLHKYIKNNYDMKEFTIHGNDKNTEVMKPLYINMFIHGIDTTNIKNRSSLSKKNNLDKLEKIDLIVGNPPFGVKNDIKWGQTVIDGSPGKPGKHYWPNVLKTGKNLIKDSMGQFMVHTINSLKPNGRFCIIMDRGILNNGKDNNSWEKKLRQFIMTVCDVEKIVLLPKGIFTHTTFDTAIMYGVKRMAFEQYHDLNLKTNPQLNTSEIQFYQAVFENPDEKLGFVVPDDYTAITIEQVVAQDWSLDFQDYQEKVVEKGLAGIPMMKLGDVCEFQIGSTPPSKESKYYNGSHLWACISDINCKYLKNTKKKISQQALTELNMKKVPKGSLLMSFKLSIGKLAFASQDMYCNEAIAFFTHFNDVEKEYLYYALKLLDYDAQSHLYNSQIGKALNKSTLKKLLIPVPSMEHQQEIVNTLDPLVQQDIGVLDAITTHYQGNFFELLLMKRYNEVELVVEYVKEMMDFTKRKARLFENQKKACFHTVAMTMMPLGEVCEFQRGKVITKEHVKKNAGPYPVIGGGISPFGYYAKYNMDENTMLVSQSGANAGHVSRYQEKVWASDCFSINAAPEHTFDNYIYVYLKLNNKIITQQQTGQAQPHIKIGNINKLLIPVPSIQDQHKVIRMIESIDEQSSNYQKAIQGNLMMIKMVQDSIEATAHGSTLSSSDKSTGETNVSHADVDNTIEVDSTDEDCTDVAIEVAINDAIKDAIGESSDIYNESSDSDDSMNSLPEEFEKSMALQMTK